MKPRKKNKLQELRERSPWAKPAERKGRGRAQGKSSFNPPISRKANAERTESNAIEVTFLRSLREP